MFVDSQNPWLGLVPYEEDNAPFFYGRSSETDELVALVERDMLSVLYGVSGLGKTSLLQAGFVPRKLNSDYATVVLRINYEGLEREGNHRIGGHLIENVSQFAKDRLISTLSVNGGSNGPPSLWEYFHHRDGRWWSAKNRPLTPVLVFDQFEEVFTLGQRTPERAARTAAFLSELSSLIYNRPPPQVQAAIERGEDVPYDFEQVPLRVVIALREDFLPHLAGLRDQGFPTIRRNEMRLLPMSAGAAREVIEVPGRELLESGVADQILAFLTGAAADGKFPLLTPDSKGCVEPALLSVVLRELNEKRQAQGQPCITATLLSGNKEAILSDFYVRAFDGLDPAVRLFVEDGLVSPNGFRDSRAIDDALSRRGVTTAALDALVNRRLLRYEDHAAGPRRIELTHDLLCAVAVESRTARIAREAEERRLAEEEKKRLQAEADAQAIAERAARQQKELRSARRVAAGFALVGLIALAALVFALSAWRRAQISAREAEAASVLAEQRRQEGEVQKKLAQQQAGEIAVQKKEADAAKELAEAGQREAKAANLKMEQAKRLAEESAQVARDQSKTALEAKATAEQLGMENGRMLLDLLPYRFASALADNDITRQKDLWADSVIYLEYGKMSRSAVLAQHQRDAQKWPFRNFTVMDRPAVSKRGANGHQLRFRLNYTSLDRNRKPSTGEEIVTIQINERLEIESFQVEVLEAEKAKR